MSRNQTLVKTGSREPDSSKNRVSDEWEPDSSKNRVSDEWEPDL